MGGNAADAPDTTKGKATAAAKTDATAIAHSDKTEGSQKAYTALMKDFNEHTKGMSTDDKNTYWKTMNDQLAKQGVLPDLAVAWGQSALTDTNRPLGDGKSISVNDLNSAIRSGTSTDASAQNQMDAAFAKSLKDQLPNLSRSDMSDVRFSSDSVDAHEFQRAFDDQQKQNQTDHQQQADRTAMEPLMANGGKLFKSLDTAKDGGKPDGEVSKGDMNAWLAAADKERSLNGSLPAKGDASGNPVVNEENYNYIKGLRDGTLKDADGKPVLQDEKMGLFHNNNNFTLEDLAKSGGFSAKDSDTDGAVAAYNAKHAGDAGVDTPATPTPAKGDAGTTKTDASGNTIKDNRDDTSGTDTYTVTSKDGTKTSTVKTKDTDDGDGGTTKQPVDVTMPDGGHYTYDQDKGKWSAASDTKDDGKKTNLGFDSSTGAVTYTGGDGKNYTEGADGKVAEVPKNGAVTHDANGADVSRDASGNVTDVKYPKDADGNVATAHFNYDSSGKITDFTDSNGNSFKSTDGGKSYKSADGNTTLTNLSVDKADGTIHYTADGQAMKVTTDGKQAVDDKATPPAKTDDPATAAAKKELEKEATQKSGEGPYQVAERILGPGASQADKNALSKALKQSWQESHGDAHHKNDGMKGLEPGYQFLNDKNLQAIMDKVPALKAKYDKLAKPATTTTKPLPDVEYV